MESYKTLERYWNKKIAEIRNYQGTKNWLSACNHTHLSSTRLSNKTIHYFIIFGKQLKVAVVNHDKHQFDPDFNDKFRSSLTRNLPHDIQGICNGKRNKHGRRKNNQQCN